MKQKITSDEQRLLWLLVRNARTPLTVVAEQVGRGRNWVARTVRRLARTGVIRAYTTVVNPLAGHIERSTILLVKTNPRETHLSGALLRVPDIESLDGISGEHSLLGLFRFSSATSFRDFLDLVDSTIARSSWKTYSLVQVLATYKTRGFEVMAPPRVNSPLSATDLEILRIVRRQTPSPERPFPLSQRDIGSRLRRPLSQPAVSKALGRLESSGVILGYSVDIPFQYLGLPIKFFVQIKASPGTIADTARTIAAIEEVWDLHRTSESYSLFATVRTSSIDDYNRFLRRLYGDENVLDTHSYISLEEWPLPAHSG